MSATLHESLTPNSRNPTFPSGSTDAHVLPKVLYNFSLPAAIASSRHMESLQEHKFTLCFSSVYYCLSSICFIMFVWCMLVLCLSNICLHCVCRVNLSGRCVYSLLSRCVYNVCRVDVCTVYRCMHDVSRLDGCGSIL